MNTSHTTGSARRLIQRGGGPGRAVGDPALVLGVAGQLPASKEPLRFWLAAWPLAPMIRWILKDLNPFSSFPGIETRRHVESIF